MSSPTPTPSAARSSVTSRRRADAERNRARVLEVARGLFTERGKDVQMDEVARQAGVGVGTLYRHFPTKRALVEATEQQRFNDILVYLRERCRLEVDVVDALVELLVHIGERHANDRAYYSVVEATLGSAEPVGDVRDQFETELADLVSKGQMAGVLRPDIAGSDIFSITCGLTSIVHRGSSDWRRYIDIVVEGLRAR